MPGVYGSAFTLGIMKAGGGEYCFSTELPPSSKFNSPKAWINDTGIVTNAANSLCQQFVIGDKLYVVGSACIDRIDLKTKVSESAIVNFPNPNSNFGNCAIAACVYDDYKIAILLPGSSYKDSYRRIYSFNSVDNTITELGSFNNGRSTGNSYDTGPGDAIFLPTKRKIYFFDCCLSQYFEDDTTSYSRAAGAVAVYSLNDNTARNIYSQPISEAGGGNLFKRGFCWCSPDESTVYYYDGLSNRRRVVKINTASDTVSIEAMAELGSIDTGLEYSPGQIIAFSGAKPILFDAYNQKVVSDVVIPEAPAVPWLRSLNKYDNQIISMNNTATMKLPYVAQEPEVKQPVWTIFAGQKYAGERELTIINKPTIQPYWQTATETFDINLGEYDSAGAYRLLIRSGDKQ